MLVEFSDLLQLEEFEQNDSLAHLHSKPEIDDSNQVWLWATWDSPY